MNPMLPPPPGGIHDEACLRQAVAGVEGAYRAFFTNLTHAWMDEDDFPSCTIFFFFCCFGLGSGVFALSRKARIWGGDDVTTPVTFCSNCTPLLFNASLHIDLERSSSKVVTPLDNGCGLTILAILFLFSLCLKNRLVPFV